MPPRSKQRSSGVAKTLIPNALSYEIRQALDVELPWDEIALLALHANFDDMSTLMSIRANAGVAERLSSMPAGECERVRYHTP